MSQCRLKTVEKWPFEIVACAAGPLCGPLLTKLCVSWDFLIQINDLQKSLADLVRITLKVKVFLKTWSFVAGLRPNQTDINSKKSYTLPKVCYGSSKKKIS